MNVLVVSGIWPPDPGGPASHASALCSFLRERGHRVTVVTTADVPPEPQPYRVRWVRRSRPAVLRHASVAASIAREALRSDVVYATSMIRRAALGAGAARRPLVVKLVSDEVFERERRRGRFDGTLDQFQDHRAGLRLTLLRATRTRALRRAEHVFCPSAYLRDFAVRWGVEPERLSVLPNPSPRLPALPGREQIRADLGLHGRVVVFAGRLGPQKSLEVAVDALRELPDVTLVVAGDGPERARLERRTRELDLNGRVRFLGAVDRDAVLRLFRAADASLLVSSWENLPHAIVESLAVGTPVVASAVGGVGEVVRDGENGLLVPPRDPHALAEALRRYFADEGLRRKLEAAAAASVAAQSEEAVFARIEDALARAAR